MLEKARRLLLDELANHVAENGAHGVEPLVRRADVVEAVVIQEYLLHNEDGDRLAQLGARLHDAEAERYYLGGQEEVDNLGRVVLDKGPDDAKRREAEILERPRLGSRVKEGIEEERDVSWPQSVSVASATPRSNITYR